ncbi:28S ribosomal protein S7, mitochondrial [Lucilia cuprina]|uniref:28S ribosomal protein S7, mitochondrial n=1 Tax=Lucilia cuprina TaxID=7375 RepID=UPI001F06B6BF|nr:28S ribosomal protein S7, mitochondrial [Lucilia cuprina]
MAVSHCSFTYCYEMFKCCISLNYVATCGTIRFMSAYPKHFINPIYSKSQQNESKVADKYNKLIHVPTKATKNDESSSIYFNEIVRKMVNYITKKGNKKLARTILENSFECMKRTQIERIHLGKHQGCTTIDPYSLIVQAIENSRPLMQLMAIKRGGVTYSVPVPVAEKRSYFLAMKWILDAAKEKERNIHLPEKLAWEVLDAAYGQGRVIKRKNDLHKQCEINRAYAHYRWS